MEGECDGRRADIGGKERSGKKSGRAGGEGKLEGGGKELEGEARS